MIYGVKKCIFLVFTILLTCIGIACADNLPQAVTATDSIAMQSTQPQISTTMPVIVPAPPDVKARAYVLMDANSGKIIAQKNMDRMMPPASLTKMMTLYLISQALHNGTIKLDDQVLISKDAWRMGGSKMFVKVGHRVAVKDLLQGIIVASGNDACVAMSEFLSGSQDVFANMMNTQAKLLGMNNSHFTDCTGLPNKDHYSTPHDLAILTRALILNFPEYYSWYQQKWFTYNGIRQPNRNRLLWRYAGADGVKTGHTNAAGFCLVSSAVRNGMRLIAVVMGAPTDEDRANDSVHLLNYGFRFYKSYAIYPPGKTVSHVRVWFGTSRHLAVGASNGVYATVPAGQFKHAEVIIETQKNLRAPITAGQQIGDVIVNVQNKPVAQVPLVALRTINRGGFFRRTIDHFSRLFHGWFGNNKMQIRELPVVEKA
ncbi:MAG: D-alanyl-D-alanine carboxypeptidase family protein [Gammaproteobacteria bacterium]|jgi:D-alanyl-D-alanine carboxypeptidase (penicillin-binding protein 5/6)